jgi:serine/threonine protein phosphatase PrpC
MTMSDSETLAKDMFNKLLSFVNESSLDQVSSLPTDLNLSTAAKRILYLIQCQEQGQNTDLIVPVDNTVSSVPFSSESSVPELPNIVGKLELAFSESSANQLEQESLSVETSSQLSVEISSSEQSSDELLSKAPPSQTMESVSSSSESSSQPESTPPTASLNTVAMNRRESTFILDTDQSSTNPSPTNCHSQGMEGEYLVDSSDITQQHQAQNTQLPIIKKEMSLPNARVGEKYEVFNSLGEIKFLALRYNDAPNIAFDTSNCIITGAPSQSGDFRIVVDGLIGGHRCEVTLNLAVIADPKSLWISKPSDSEALYAKADESSSYCIASNVLMLGASKRGRSHAQVGSFRDDDYSIAFTQDSQWYLAVVADGAGSATYSRRGSQIVSESIQRSMPELLKEHLHDIEVLVDNFLCNEPSVEKVIRNKLYLTLAMAGFTAANEIYQEALRSEIPEDSFSTTLIIAIARKCAQNWFVAGFGIGDGGAGVLDLDSRQVFTLNKPDSGDYGGQTRFLHPSAFKDNVEISQRIFFDVRKGLDALILMTDGITDPKFPTDNAFNNFETWHHFWHDELTSEVDILNGGPECEQQLLEWLDFWSPGNHDDRTIVVLKPLGE